LLVTYREHLQGIAIYAVSCFDAHKDNYHILYIRAKFPTNTPRCHQWGGFVIGGGGCLAGLSHTRTILLIRFSTWLAGDNESLTHLSNTCSVSTYKSIHCSLRIICTQTDVSPDRPTIYATQFTETLPDVLPFHCLISSFIIGSLSVALIVTVSQQSAAFVHILWPKSYAICKTTSIYTVVLNHYSGDTAVKNAQFNRLVD